MIKSENKSLKFIFIGFSTEPINKDEKILVREEYS